MIDFIVKYWVEFLFGLIAAGLGGYIKYSISVYKKGLKATKNEETEALLKGLAEQQNENQKQVLSAIEATEERSRQARENLEKKYGQLQEGLLSIQGREFKSECRKLLEEDHIITLNEYENVCKDHRVYNDLGGNHEGDALFGLVEIKYSTCLVNIKKEEDC